MTPKQAQDLKRAIRQLERAEISLSWIGSKPPCDHEIIKTEHKSATARVGVLIVRLITK